MINVLVVDDSIVARKRIIQTIETLEVEYSIVSQAQDGIEALELFKTLDINLIVTDLEMPQMGGLQLIQEIRKINTSLDIIVVSSLVNEQIKQSLKNDANINFVKKPVNARVFTALFLNIEHKLSKGE